MKHKWRSWAGFCVTVLALLVASPVSAAVIGQLSVSSVGGGGVTVSAALIDWFPAINNITTGGDTNVSYTTGVLGPSTLGTALDIPAFVTFPLVDFMTFSGHPNLHFDLSQLGPGSANSNCAALNDFSQVGQSCSPLVDPDGVGPQPAFASPFILTVNPTGTGVLLAARGNARDLSATVSLWSGAFTTQIAGQTPAQIAATIQGGGAITSTQSGEFTVSFIPEPATMALMGSGLLLLGFVGRRFRK